MSGDCQSDDLTAQTISISQAVLGCVGMLTMFIIRMVVFGLIIIGLPRLFPQIPPWGMMILIVLTVMAVELFFQWLQHGQQLSKENLVRWVLGAIALHLFVNHEKSDKYVAEFFGYILPLFIFIVGPELLKYWVNRPFEQANYALALSRLDMLQRLGLEWLVEPERGVVSLWAGHFSEAETALKKYLAALKNNIKQVKQNKFLGWLNERIGHFFSQNSFQTARLLTYLGYALMEQRRYKEAAQRFRKADQCYPQSGAAVGLAEVYLRQQLEPEQALALLDQLATDNPELTEHANSGEYWVNRAWAWILLAQPAEAEASLKRALLHLNDLPKPHQAGLLYRAGLVARLMDNRQTADEHFRQAAQLDPHGNFGQRAAKALRGFGS